MRALNLVAGIALAAALVGCSSDGTDKADEKPRAEATSSKTSVSKSPTNAGPTTDTPPEDAKADCTPLDASDITGVSDGLRKKGAKVTGGYAEPVGDDIGLGIDYAWAVRVEDGASTADVVLGSGGEHVGDGLLIGTVPALEWFTWGDAATAGSPAGDAQVALLGSEAAERALACLK